MKILIIGSGAREHAIIKSLYSSSTKLYCYITNTNPGINKLATVFMTDPVNYALEHNIDICIIGSEKWLAEGLVDSMIENGIKCIGPTKNLAQIETNKFYARELIPEKYSPKYNFFNKTNWCNLCEYLNYINYEFVIKANGLHSGKGVHINFKNPVEICERYKSEGVLIEEKLYGKEFSLMSFTDGINFIHLDPIQDDKLYNGENTGGMGCIYWDTIYKTEAERINEMIIHRLQERENGIYCGIIYGSFMETKDGLKVIEYNARFGDPECILLLERINNLADIFYAMVNSKLDSVKIDLTDRINNICKYLVPNGYPSNPIKNHEFYINNFEKYNNNIYFGGVNSKNGYYYETGSRTLAIVGKNNDEIHKIIKNIWGLFEWKNTSSVINYPVNINEANLVVSNLKKQITNIGGFGCEYDDLVASVDGVGTKSIIVLEYMGEVGYYNLGMDLVNHCINDILVQGAKPLFFLDYFGCGKLYHKNVENFIRGINYCANKIGFSVIGGETAEMNIIYGEHCDLVGMIVGKKNWKWSGIKEGNWVIGLKSSGLHTNGYSLVNKLNWEKWGDDLCKVHKCYWDEIVKMINNGKNITGLCHITGGGLIDNPPRVMDNNLKIEYNSWDIPEIFKWIQKESGISDYELMRTYNCGIGMMVFTDTISSDDWIIGKVVSS